MKKVLQPWGQVCRLILIFSSHISKRLKSILMGSYCMADLVFYEINFSAKESGPEYLARNRGTEHDHKFWSEKKDPV